MKKIFLSAFLFFISLSSNAQAAEQMGVDGLAGSLAANSSASDSFAYVVKGNGEIKTNAGPLFTEGGDYAGMMLPYLLSNPKPIPYPRWAIRQGWQGRLSVAIEILPDGTVGRYKVMKSTGHKHLDDAAISSLKSWKFQPATKDGKIIVTCIQIPITFELD